MLVFRSNFYDLTSSPTKRVLYFGQVTDELQHDRVSSAELVHAVYEMLSAAGINMDVEKKNLLQTVLTLQEELRESQAVLLLEQVIVILTAIFLFAKFTLHIFYEL